MRDDTVVLLDELGNCMGAAPKMSIHHRATPLHLGFSCYAIDQHCNVLLTRRAADKKTWPGAWTNSCCDHPLSGELIESAVARRFLHELGATAISLDLILPRFRYRAVMSNGVVENEMCPVFRAQLDPTLRVNPREVAETRWEAWTTFAAEVTGGERIVSPWCKEQVTELTGLGADPWTWPVAPRRDLPAALR
jgi:isopentenyl-diphosphate delta-isomerase